MAHDDIRLPSGSQDEKEVLLQWLDHLCRAVLRNLDGTEARWSPDGRPIPLVGVVRHPTRVEWGRIDGFSGVGVSRSAEECRPGPDVTLDAVVTACRERAHATDAMIRSLALRGHRSRIAGLEPRISGGWSYISSTRRRAPHRSAMEGLEVWRRMILPVRIDGNPAELSQPRHEGEATRWSRRGRGRQDQAPAARLAVTAQKLAASAGKRAHDRRLGGTGCCRASSAVPPFRCPPTIFGALIGTAHGSGSRGSEEGARTSKLTPPARTPLRSPVRRRCTSSRARSGLVGGASLAGAW